jgi:hypothetical protein
VAADHDAVDGRADDRAIHTQARPVEHGLRGRNVGSTGLEGGLCIGCRQPREIELCGGHDIFGRERLGPGDLPAGIIDNSLQAGMFRARLCEPGLSLCDLRLIHGRIEAGDDLSLSHTVIEICFDRVDRSGDLGAESDGSGCLKRTGDQRAARDRALCHFGGLGPDRFAGTATQARQRCKCRQHASGREHGRTVVSAHSKSAYVRNASY